METARGIENKNVGEEKRIKRGEVNLGGTAASVQILVGGKGRGCKGTSTNTSTGFAW